jgi:hypothetical protein
MTATPANSRATLALLAIAAGFVALAFAMWSPARAAAAAIGATLSVLNWFALRWLTERIAHGGGANKGGAALLLVAKMGLLMAVVYVLIQRLSVDPIGLAFGLGVLFIGPVVTALVGPGAASSITAAGAQAAVRTKEES